MESARQPLTVRRQTAHQPDIRRWIGLASALILGLSVRLPFILGADFPLNDGGLFYAMVQDLQDARYVPPAFTSYNSAGIPFAYPPLAFYAAALLTDVTPLGLVDVLRFFPLAMNLLSIVAFHFFARSLLGSKLAADFATAAFALLPRSFEWLIMGGGLTRSLGFLLAILAIHQAYIVYARPLACSESHKGISPERERARRILLAAMLAGCTALTHLEMAVLIAYTIPILALLYGRNRQAIASTALIGLGASAIAVPWWATIVARHGVSPLLAASDQGWPLFSGVLSLLCYNITYEASFPILYCLAVVGALVCLARRDVFPMLWLVPMFALDPRSAPTPATMPLALLAGVGLTRVLLPALHRLNRFLTPAFSGAGHVHGLLATSPRLHPNSVMGSGASPAQNNLALAALTVIAMYATNSALIGERPLLTELPVEQRQAMQWVAANTPHDARFLVITTYTWAEDRVSEWFPVLAKRESVATVQGHEWTGLFRERMWQHHSAQACAEKDATCLEEWTRGTSLSFDYVYVAKRSTVTTSDCCAPLRHSLYNGDGYRTVYDGPGATIFVRKLGVP